MKIYLLVLVLQLIVQSSPVSAATQCAPIQFHEIVGFDCIDIAFVKVISDVTLDVVCLRLCAAASSCLAFSMETGLCRLFEFDACSRNLWSDCSCEKKSKFYVKHVSGLPVGSVCPEGFNNHRCGVKYKPITSSDRWLNQRKLCNSLGGLAFMADVGDINELDHMRGVMNNSAVTRFFLAGHQYPSTNVATDNWIWDKCGTPIDSSLWSGGEPNNYGGKQNITVSWSDSLKLVDRDFDDTRPAICKCVSPFG